MEATFSIKLLTYILVIAVCLLALIVTGLLGLVEHLKTELKRKEFSEQPNNIEHGK